MTYLHGSIRSMIGKPKVVVLIPALNESQTISRVIKDVPHRLAGIDAIEIVVINDGSTDATDRVAKTAGATIVINHASVQGLALSFKVGIAEAIKRNASIIVTTDADNQYDSSEIPKLIQPLLNQQADMVIGNRQVFRLPHMPLNKKWGNIIGTWLLGLLIREKVADASSGFRAFTRECALSFHIKSTHTYTHETIIRAHQNNLRVLYVPITFRERTSGDSRLIHGVTQHIMASIKTIVKSLRHRP